jgi:hypothetical protein
MADISNLKIGNSLYSIKDPTARTTANNADTKADQAIIDSAQAQSTANSADTKATNANTKIDGTNLIGTYTSGTETLEISLEIGSV